MVNGSARCLNTLYVNDLNVSGTTSFASLATTGDASIGGHLTVGYSNTSQDSQISTHGVISDRWLRSVGNVGWYSQTYIGGIYMKNAHAIRTYNSKNFFVENGDFYVGTTADNPTATDAPVYYFKRDGSLYASNIKAGNGRINNLFVEDELRATRYNISTIADLGGQFIVAPTLYLVASGSVGDLQIDDPITTTVDVTAISSDSEGYNLQLDITSSAIGSADTDTTFAGASWSNGSTVKVSGKIGGVVLGACNGKLTSHMSKTNQTLHLKIKYTGQTINTINPGRYSTADANNPLQELNVMLTAVNVSNNLNKVGIYMTSYDANKRSHISLYGGNDTVPMVRIGNLQGLPAIGGQSPDDLQGSKWGIYTNNGFFKGTIAAERGVIGSNATLTNNWQIGDRSIWYGNATPGASSSSLVISTGTASTNNIAGSGTNSSKTWMIAAGTNFGVTNTGAMYATGANVTGVLNATTGTFGDGTHKITVGNGGTAYSAIRYGMTTLGDTTHDGFYIGTNGIALGKGTFLVNADGSAVFKNATLGDPNAYHVSIDSDSVDIWNGIETNPDNSIATFGQTTRVGYTGDNGGYIQISDTGFKVYGLYKQGSLIMGYPTDVLAELKGSRFTVGVTNKTGKTALYENRIYSYDKSGVLFFCIGSCEDINGLVGHTDTFTGDGNTTVFSLAYKPWSWEGENSVSVLINGVLQTLETDYYPAVTTDVNNTDLHFVNPPPDGASILVSYYSNTTIPGYTFGQRRTGGYGGLYSTCFGYQNECAGEYSFCVGSNVGAYGDYSIAIGDSTIASGKSSFSCGYHTLASNTYSYAQGCETSAAGIASHAEGQETLASGNFSHAEGYKTTASDEYAHAEGISTVASGPYGSHAEGHSTVASSWYSHAEGYESKAKGHGSHAEGHSSTASDEGSHAEGYNTFAEGTASHAEGMGTHATGNGSHAEGYYSMAIGEGSHAQNSNTYATEDYSTTIGKYNEVTSTTVNEETTYDAGNYVLIIGNGTSSNRSNALTIDWNGFIQRRSLIMSSDSNVTAPSSNTTLASNSYYDINDHQIGYDQIVLNTGNNLYRSFAVTRQVNNATITHAMYMGIETSGDRYVSFSEPQAWRSGLGLKRGSSITRTYTSNSYVNQTNFNRLAAYQIGNLVYITGNLSLSTAMPKSSDWVTIGSFDITPNVTWYESVAGCGSGSNIPALGVQITTSGVIQIYNYSNTSAPSGAWYRFTAIIPIE